MQFAEKGMARRIPWPFPSQINCGSLGLGVNHWGDIFRPLQTTGAACENIHWRSEVALSPRLSQSEGYLAGAHIFTCTMPRDRRDIIPLSARLGRYGPTIVVCDTHPSLPDQTQDSRRPSPPPYTFRKWKVNNSKMAGSVVGS